MLRRQGAGQAAQGPGTPVPVGATQAAAAGAVKPAPGAASGGGRGGSVSPPRRPMEPAGKSSSADIGELGLRGPGHSGDGGRVIAEGVGAAAGELSPAKAQPAGAADSGSGNAPPAVAMAMDGRLQDRLQALEALTRAVLQQP